MRDNNLPLQSKCAEDLRAHYQQIKSQHMHDMFNQDAQRVEKLSIKALDLYCDYSKNRIVPHTIDLLIKLAEYADLEQWREKLFNGDKINLSEQNSATHTQIRNLKKNKDGTYSGEYADTFNRMRELSDALRNRKLVGHSGETIRDVVCLGIGGSYLGNAMACNAFPSNDNVVRVHFVSNVGGNEINQLLQELTPKQTLFITISKSWSNWETLTNFKHVLNWVGNTPEILAKHLIILSNNQDAISEFHISEKQFFMIPSSIGGRYSLCSVVGLPFAIHSGMDAFEELLSGAHQMDMHFYNAPLQSNMPLIMSLLDIWYINFFNTQTHAILTYANALELFPNYLQQLEMESNGKHLSQDGQPLTSDSAAVIWGGLALHGQHSFYQLLHQGTRLVPIDFIVEAHQPDIEDHHKLYANFFAHSHLLLNGKDDGDTHCIYPGNQPSTTLMIKKLTPQTLGSLIALYEHKVFCNATIWNINPFDQWGVSEGKKLSNSLYQKIASDSEIELDKSTDQLIQKYKHWD